MAGVRVSGLLKKYGDIIAVDDLTVAFEKGTLTTLLGPSGCGKTTTLRCIAGLEKPDAGVISIDDAVVFSNNVNIPPEKRMVGIVFQSYAIWPHMTVFDNIAFPLKIRHESKQQISQKVRKIMDMVRLTGLEDRPATQVSGGQQQRIALARALIFDPQLLLLDEPLSNLDTSLRDIVRVEVREIQRSLGITTIYVTHDQVEALSISDKVVVLNAGKIMAEGAPREIYSNPSNEFIASFVGKANLFQGKLARAGAGLAVIQTDFGRISCRMNEGTSVKEGDRVVVAIKPENVVVDSAGRGEMRSLGENTFSGRVEFTSYLGAFSEVLVSINNGGPGGHVARAVKNSEDAQFEEGGDVTVTFPPEHCVLLVADGTR